MTSFFTPQNLTALAVPLTTYKSMNEIQAYQKDGKQQTFLSAALANRILVLNSEWQLAGYQGSPSIVLATLVFTCCKSLTPLFKVISLLTHGAIYDPQRVKGSLDPYIGRVSYIIEPGIHFLFFLRKALLHPVIFETFDSLSDRLLNYTSALVNTACIVSYVAMIVWGSPVSGGAGLFQMALLLIKHNGLLPSVLDEKLSTLSLFGSFYLFLTLETTNFWEKLSKLVLCTKTGIEVLKYFHEKLTQALGWDQPSPSNLHQVEEVNSLDKVIRSSQDVIEILNKEFSLNATSLHANELDSILPEEDSTPLVKEELEALYTEVEEKLNEVNNSIVGSSGWITLKSAVIDGKVADVTPTYFEKTRKIIRSILKSLIKAEDRLDKAAELAEIGEACSEGWLRDTTFLLQPETKDIRWAVHHQLANHRSELIISNIGLIGKNIATKKKISLLNIFSSSGEENNIHLINQLQAAVWHRWRPYLGELYLQTQGRGWLLQWLQKKIVKKNAEELNDLENRVVFLRELLISEALVELPLPILAIEISDEINKIMINNYTSKNIVKSIKTAIFMRTIPWSLIQTWLGKLSEKGLQVLALDSHDEKKQEISLEPSHGYHPALVKEVSDPTSKKKQFILTKTGVKLLLWDLGILHPKT